MEFLHQHISLKFLRKYNPEVTGNLNINCLDGFSLFFFTCILLLHYWQIICICWRESIDININDGIFGRCTMLLLQMFGKLHWHWLGTHCSSKLTSRELFNMLRVSIINVILAVSIYDNVWWVISTNCFNAAASTVLNIFWIFNFYVRFYQLLEKLGRGNAMQGNPGRWRTHRWKILWKSTWDIRVKS